MIYKAIGLMSGTSMDGIDVAFIETDGQKYVKQLATHEGEYPKELKQRLRLALIEAQSFDDGAACHKYFAELGAEITKAQISVVQDFMKMHDVESSAVDLIGFHGQTILHRPDLSFTVQLGDGEMMARALNIPVIYDFRSNDMTAGGEGAPLAPVYHQALSAKVGKYPVAFLNIGGVSNMTYIECKGAEPIAFDCGPGNALIDDWIYEHTEAAYDKDGAIAACGKVDEEALEQLTSHEYFSRPAPKSLDRNTFVSENLLDAMGDLSLEDGAATLVAFTAKAVVDSQKLLPRAPDVWLICGGGRKNAAIMRDMALRVGSASIAAVDDYNMDGDFMEAEAFGYLAVRSKLGLAISFPKTTGCKVPMTGGVLVEHK